MTRTSITRTSITQDHETGPAWAAPATTGLREVRHVMGMPVGVDLRDTTVGRSALDAVRAWLTWVDETFSTYRPDSPVSRLGRGELDLAGCPAEVAEVLDLCERLRGESDGYFDARATGRLDLSGVVKGWAVDGASALLRAAGSTNHSVNAGGDVVVRGRPEPGRNWRVGVVHPVHHDALTTVVTGSDLAVATSGAYERGDHVVNPHAGAPASGLLSVTVTGPTLTLADGYATAAFAMGRRAPDWLAALDARTGYASYLVDADGRAWWSDGFERIGWVPGPAGRAVDGWRALRGPLPAPR